MSKPTAGVTILLCSASLALMACSSSNPSGPNPTPTSLKAVSPSGGASAVDVTAPIELTFSGPMASGMEAYMDVHQGTTAGAVAPMTCTWSGDRTTLTCTHTTPFAAGQAYTIHVGDGMMDADDMPIDMSDMVGQMGGVWLQSGMMGGMHAGQPTSMLGTGWHGSNGSYGMIFTFTTS